MKFSKGALLTALITLVLLEWLLHIMEHHLRFHHLNLLRRSWYEYQYFAHSKEIPSPETPKDFDPVLGWKAFRHPLPTKKDPSRKRVVVLGDSFMYGINLADNETAAHYLQERLGKEYEVLNLAVRGYGLDQMILAAREVALPLEPDFIIVGFIGADLGRSCYDFLFNARKPMAGKAFPVSTPYETWSAHQSLLAKVRDNAASLIMRSRTICLLAEFAMTSPYIDCTVHTNLDWLRELQEFVPTPSRVVLSHLDWWVPTEFETGARQFGFHYLDFFSKEKEWSERENIAVERFEDRHPKASLNRLYAAALEKTLRSVERSLSTNSVESVDVKSY